MICLYQPQLSNLHIINHNTQLFWLQQKKQKYGHMPNCVSLKDTTRNDEMKGFFLSWLNSYVILESKFVIFVLLCYLSVTA